MIVMSGEASTLGEDPNLDIEQQWYGGLSVGGIERYVENITKLARPVTSPHTLYGQVIRAGEMAQRTRADRSISMSRLSTCCMTGHRRRATAGARGARVQAHPSEVEKVADLLLSAKNPIVVAEQSGRDPAAFHALVELSDLLGLPVTWSRGANFTNSRPTIRIISALPATSTLPTPIWFCSWGAAYRGTRRMCGRPRARSSPSTRTSSRTT